MGRWARVGLVAAVVVIGLPGYAWYRAEEERDEERRLRELVHVTVAYDPGCPREAPLSVTVDNGTNYTLKRVDYDVTVYEPGRSEPIGSSLDGHRSWDIIVGPLGTVQRCAPDLALDRRVERVRRVVSVWNAQFYKPGEFIPR